MQKTNMAALKDFFNTPPLSMTELKALTKDERADLADQVFAETGWTRIAS